MGNTLSNFSSRLGVQEMFPRKEFGSGKGDYWKRWVWQGHQGQEHVGPCVLGKTFKLYTWGQMGFKQQCNVIGFTHQKMTYKWLVWLCVDWIGEFLLLQQWRTFLLQKKNIPEREAMISQGPVAHQELQKPLPNSQSKVRMKLRNCPGGGRAESWATTLSQDSRGGQNVPCGWHPLAPGRSGCEYSSVESV